MKSRTPRRAAAAARGPPGKKGCAVVVGGSQELGGAGARRRPPSQTTLLGTRARPSLPRAAVFQKRQRSQPHSASSPRPEPEEP